MIHRILNDNSDEDVRFNFTGQRRLTVRNLRRRLIRIYGINAVGTIIGTIQDSYISSSSDNVIHPPELQRLQEYMEMKENDVQCRNISSSSSSVDKKFNFFLFMSIKFLCNFKKKLRS